MCWLWFEILIDLCNTILQYLKFQKEADLIYARSKLETTQEYCEL